MATAYEKVQLARGKGRPSGLSFIQNIFPDFIELHGDRRFADDPAVIGGIATLGGRAVTVIAIEKGADTKDKVYRNFGSPNPEGYRKALRLMKQAEKFHRPVICFVDTSGAFCGIGAEERGQGQAIAENLVEMIGQRRRTCAGGCGPRVDFGERRVFRRFPGGLREHSLERCKESEGSRRVSASYRAGHGKAWRCGTRHQ